MRSQCARFGCTLSFGTARSRILASETKPTPPRRAPLLMALLAAVLLLAATLVPVKHWTRARALSDLADSSGHVLTLVAETLAGELAKHQSTPFLLSHNPRLVRIVTGTASIEETAAASEELARLAQVTDASDIYLMNTSGMTVAASNYDQPRSFVGQNFSYRPYFIEAMKGRLGRYFALGTTSGERGYYFAHPIFEGRYVVGVAVVKIQVGQLEAAWRTTDQEIMVVDEDGVVFLSSKPQWVMRTLGPLSEEARRRIAEHRRYDGRNLVALARGMGETVGKIGRIIRLEHPPGATDTGVAPAETSARMTAPPMTEYLMQSRAMPDAGWTIHILANTRAIDGQVNAALALVLATFAALLLAAIAIYQRRRRITERLQLQATVNAELERRVALRTDELTRANRQLEAEVTERRRTENELRQTQSELVQASKLAALGQMSAGLSHELNQPLAAIRSYADNARRFLERERYETTGANLGLIVELTERMARIIRHLRTYARKEPTTVRPTPVLRAIEESLTLMNRCIQDAGVTVTIEAPDTELHAIAGEVRLQQVIVNLVSNALDAMTASKKKVLTITLTEEADAVTITVADTGPGIPPENLTSVFDPFFTTKEVGAGLGLGLSITYGIVQQFGGTIAAQNNDGNGATFEVRLLPARAQTETAA